MIDDLATVTVCAGPPECPFEGDEAVANAQAGCPICRRITINPDGTETEYQRKAN